MPDKLVQLTDHDIKTKRMDTMYGNISFYEWLEKERDRILVTPGRRAVIRKKGDKFALWVDDIAGIHDQYLPSSHWKSGLQRRMPKIVALALDEKHEIDCERRE